MNTFFQKLLSIQYGKPCPDIKLVVSDKDIVHVTFTDGKKKSFRITATHIKEGI